MSYFIIVMIYQISHENCEISPRSWKIIKRDISKITRFLPGLTGELPKLAVYIEWNSRRKFYSGWINLDLPKKTLRADILGPIMENALVKSFKGLIRELTKYETLHIKSNSRYPKHESIRLNFK